MKKLITFVILLFIIFFIKAEGKNIMKIEPSFTYSKTNETIFVNITVIPSENISGAQCNIFFNSSILLAKEVRNGGAI